MSRKTLKLDKNTAIHCPTQALAEKVSKYVSGIDPTLWKYRKENTCLYIQGTYSALGYAKGNNHKVVTAEGVIAHFENQDLYSRLVKPEVAIHCKTEEEAKQLLKWAHDQDLKWSDGQSYLDHTAYYRNEDNICYSFSTGGYSNIDFYKSEGYDIIEFSSIPEFQTNPITTYNIDKSKLKPNTVIQCDTFEKALAITSAIGGQDPIDYTTYILYGNKTAIRVLADSWTYEDISYYEQYQKFTIIPFEEILMKSEDTAPTEFQIGDLIYWTENAEKHLSSAKANELVGKVVSIEERKHTSPLIKYEDTEKQLGSVDSGWVTKVPPVLVTYVESKVAQQEPNQLTITKETLMSKLKATVDQNKEALVIASKMEAGRIINKQVLKQLTPHLPFFLQGYAKSPFAPFIAANLVAMVANHTGNSKLTKVSDLMLLGAADSGVAAFNLDKIVDDILSSIKLPAGILDDSDE